MSDSDPNFKPADDTPRRKRPARRDDADDEIVDLSQYEPVDEGSAVLSHSGRQSGPISGSSIVSWDELARAHGPSEGEEFTAHGSDGIDFDAASDIDLLQKVLSNDPPPSAIIVKDPSSPETPALPSDDDSYDAAESALEGFEDEDGAPGSRGSGRRLPRVSPSRPPADADAFTLPPELSSRDVANAPAGDEDDEFQRPAAGSGGSSILDEAPTAGEHSGISSNVWADSSRVDLLAAPKPLDVSSGSLQHTDEVDAPPVMSFPSTGDSATLLGEMADDDLESSAVDLGSQAAIDLPFPLGLDSSVGSSAVDKPKSKPSGGCSSDSGTVDLLAGSGEFDLGAVTGMSSVVRQLRTERDDLPPTTPLDAPRPGRAGAWLGGSLLGLAAGIGAAAGVWYAGYIPPSEQYAALATPVNKALPAPAPAAAAALVAAEEKATKLSEELKKQKKLTDDAGRAKAELERLRGHLTAAKLNPADLGGVAQRLAGADEAIARAGQANQTLAQLLDRLKAAKLDPADLDGSLKNINDARAKAEAALKDTSAEVTRLREQADRAVASAREAEEKLRAQTAGSTASPPQSLDVARQVTAKLQAAKLVGANPPPGELLAALDRALQGRPAADAASPRGVPPIPAPAAPAAPSANVESLLAAGVKAVTARDYASAIGGLTAAAKANPRDARAYYLLAVARMQTGELAAAYQLFTAARKVELLGETNADELAAILRQLTPTEQRILGRFRE